MFGSKHRIFIADDDVSRSGVPCDWKSVRWQKLRICGIVFLTVFCVCHAAVCAIISDRPCFSIPGPEIFVVPTNSGSKRPINEPTRQHFWAGSRLHSFLVKKLRVRGSRVRGIRRCGARSRPSRGPPGGNEFASGSARSSSCHFQPPERVVAQVRIGSEGLWRREFIASSEPTVSNVAAAAMAAAAGRPEVCRDFLKVRSRPDRPSRPTRRAASAVPDLGHRRIDGPGS